MYEIMTVHTSASTISLSTLGGRLEKNLYVTLPKKISPLQDKVWSLSLHSFLNLKGYFRNGESYRSVTQNLLSYLFIFKKVFWRQPLAVTCIFWILCACLTSQLDIMKYVWTEWRKPAKQFRSAYEISFTVIPHSLPFPVFRSVLIFTSRTQ